jgi:RNA polymerase sigma-70 factor (ECF subfamily)
MLFKKKKNIEDLEIEKASQDLRKGSAEAFHILYSKYSQPVYRYCFKMLGDSSAAEDAFQEAFMKVYEHRKDFRGENFAAWLFTIARHTCLNIIRTRKDKEEFDEDLHAGFKTNDSDIALKELLDKTISQLPLALKEALILREYDDYSYQEISDMLGIELSLAKVRVHRARILLRKMLQPLVKEINEY